jgi:ribokinase
MIVVFGSINLDLVFNVESLPREGETVLTDGVALVPGGKGANQAVAAARAGHDPVVMVGHVGSDAFADIALVGLKEAGVDLTGLGRSLRPTGCASIAVDRHGRNQILVASGANLDTRHPLVRDEWLHRDSLMLLQNEVSEAENLAVARRAKAHGARVVLNAAPARPLRCENWSGLLDYLVVNEGEARDIAGAPSPSAILSLATELQATIIVTLGAKGVRAVTREGNSLALPALEIHRVVDTTAAGDCFTGALAAFIREGESLPASLAFASAAGGLACLKPGAQISAPSRDEILAALPRLGFAYDWS